MRVLIRRQRVGVRTPVSFGISAGIHGSILAWLALSPQGAPAPRRLTIYEQQIQPNEKHIVWYNLRDRLPDVSPVEARHDPRPPRALRHFNQDIVAGVKDKANATQMIFMPAPEVRTAKPLPLPNVLAVSSPARLVRTFTPPVEKKSAVAATPIPEAPAVSTAMEQRSQPLATPLARPLKTFTAPPEVQHAPAKLTLPEAPGVAAVVKDEQLPVDFANPRVQPRRFTPPPATPVRSAPVILPEAPGVAAPATARNLPAAVPDPRAPLRRFNAPPTKQVPAPSPAELPAAPEVGAPNQARNLPAAVPDPRAPLRRFNAPATKQSPAASPAELPAAPEVGVPNQARNLPAAVPDPRAPLRRFNAPPTKQAPAASPAELPAAPTVAGASGNGETTLAIVGLHPTTAPDFPKPPGSREGGFSAGPKPNKAGSDGAATDGTIVVPWLTTRGGAKDSQPTMVVNPDSPVKENLLAAARSPMRTPFPAAALPSATPSATRVSSAPDPRLQGRAVYSIAIQMPNITSYSGSWIVWFSERQPIPGAPPPEVRAPVPLRKVDPKYIAEAAQERVEGTVRLFAVIRQDGHVESVSLIRHLDDRLDQSAQEALAKWVFEPALRNGSPMDVEAVFEIPFRLAPRSPR